MRQLLAHSHTCQLSRHSNPSNQLLKTTYLHQQSSRQRRRRCHSWHEGVQTSCEACSPFRWYPPLPAVLILVMNPRKDTTRNLVQHGRSSSQGWGRVAALGLRLQGKRRALWMIRWRVVSSSMADRMFPRPMSMSLLKDIDASAKDGWCCYICMPRVRTSSNLVHRIVTSDRRS